MKYIIPPSIPVIGPYSPAVEVDNLVFTSGQIGTTQDGNFAGESVEEQCKQALQNLSTVLESAGVSIKNVIKTTVFLTQMSDYPVVNQIYADFFGNTKPARSAVSVKELPKGAKFEIEAIAYKS